MRNVLVWMKSINNNVIKQIPTKKIKALNKLWHIFLKTKKQWALFFNHLGWIISSWKPWHDITRTRLAVRICQGS